MRRFAFYAALAVSLCGCARAKNRALQPSSELHGGMAISIWFRRAPLPALKSYFATDMFFAKLDAAGKPRYDEVYPASLTREPLVYLLDVPPGKYAPVFVGFRKGRARYRLRLPEVDIKQWTGEVKPGELSFVSAVLVQRDAEPVSEYLWSALRRVLQYLPPFKAVTIPIKTAFIRLEPKIISDAEVWRRARVDLAGSTWISAIDRKIAQFGERPDPIKEGFIRKREVPHKEGGEFVWQDTLDWGPPRRRERGLEWNEPGGRARIAAEFTKDGEKGGLPLEELLKDLRAAGSPEDAHSVSELQLSSWTAYGARYTTYRYPREALVGAKVEVETTETLIVPVIGGHYRLVLTAPRQHFERQREEFRRFLRYVVFKRRQPKKP